MTESDLVDLPPERPAARARAMRWVVRALVVAIIIGLPLVAARIHYGGQSRQAYDVLASMARVFDRGQTVSRHGEYPPCENGTNGWLERTYAPGPRSQERLLATMSSLGWQPTTDLGESVIRWTRPSTGGSAVARFTKASGELVVEAPGHLLGCLWP